MFPFVRPSSPRNKEYDHSFARTTAKVLGVLVVNLCRSKLDELAVGFRQIPVPLLVILLQVRQKARELPSLRGPLAGANEEVAASCVWISISDWPRGRTWGQQLLQK